MSGLTCPNGECEHSTTPQVERDYSLRGRGGALLRVYCPSCGLYGPLANTEAEAIRLFKLLSADRRRLQRLLTADHNFHHGATLDDAKALHRERRRE